MIYTQIIILGISVALIVCSIFLVSKFQTWFVKNRLLLLSIFLFSGLLLYAVGYLLKYPHSEVSAILMAIFSTGRMLVLENDFESISSGVVDFPQFHFLFALVMTLSMLTVGMVALSYTGYRVLCKIQLGFLKIITWKKKVFIFSELNERALILAKDIKQQHKKSVLIFCVPAIEEEEEQLELEKEASQNGFFVISLQNALEKEVVGLCRQFRTKKLYLFFISEEEMCNIASCATVAELYHKKPFAMKEIDTFLWIYSNDYAVLLNHACYQFMEIHTINESELAVRKLFSEMTLITKEEEALSVCLIGFNQIAEHILKNVISLLQAKNRTIHIIILEEDARNQSAVFFNQNPEITKVAEFSFVEKRENTKEYFVYLNEIISNIDYVFYVNQDLKALTELYRLKQRNESNTKICCYFAEKPEYEKMLSVEPFDEIHFFGNWQELYVDDLIIDEKLDCLAKGFHKYYSELYQDERRWEDISLFEKQSNRALALSIQTKLQRLGLCYKVGKSIELYEEKIKEKEILLQLTKEEHLRWNAFYFSNGWRTLTLDTNNPVNKKAVTKEHVCLVSFEELIAIGEVFGKDYQEADRHLMLNLGKVLQQAGFGIEKINTRK